MLLGLRCCIPYRKSISDTEHTRTHTHTHSHASMRQRWHAASFLRYIPGHFAVLPDAHAFANCGNEANRFPLPLAHFDLSTGSRGKRKTQRFRLAICDWRRIAVWRAGTIYLASRMSAITAHRSGCSCRFGSSNGISRFPRARGNTCARMIVSVTCCCRFLKHMTELYGLYDHSGV